MSSNKVGEWQLDDLKDGLETREQYEDFGDKTKVTGAQCRDHWTLTRHRKIHASVDFRSVKGTTSNDLQYFVGSYRKTKSAKIRFDGSSASSGDAYLCVECGFAPEQPGTPGDYCIERQTWEFYSKWREAPTAWNLVDE